MKTLILTFAAIFTIAAGTLFLSPTPAECYGCMSKNSPCYSDFSCGEGCTCIQPDLLKAGFCS